jgi:hypothetical protein
MAAWIAAIINTNPIITGEVNLTCVNPTASKVSNDSAVKVIMYNL